MQKTTHPLPAQPAPLFRIGAVAKLAGIPVSTLRIWELRHQAFSPSKTTGQHRLYSQDDVLKARLLKQLSRDGHLVSAIANLDASALGRLHNPTGLPAELPLPLTLPAKTVSLAVIGAGMAGRVDSKKFTRHFLSHTIRVTDQFEGLAQADASPFREKPQILLVKVNTLHDTVRAEIQALARQQGVLQTVVLYSFAKESVVHAMRVGGVLVRREPVSDYELSDLVSSVLIVDAAKSDGGVLSDAVIPARKYSDDTLSYVASISTNVLCECPRHVAELIAQLASFEQYSQECLNKSDEDAHLHAYLHAISGSARALFERALDMVAEHEQIALATIDPAGPGGR